MIKRIIVIIILLLLLLLSGCTKTQYVPVETIKTEYINKVDSFFLHDSVFVLEKKQNDTTYIYKEKYKTIKEVHTDTLVKVDTIPIIKTVTITKVVNKLNTLQRILIYIGITSIIIIVYLIYRKFK